MHWVWLAAAIGLEVCGTTSMKLSEGFQRPLYSVGIFVFYALSFTCLTLALKRIDVSVAYALWAGLGTVLISLIGIARFKEPSSALKLASLGLIVAGVVGLHLSGTVH